MNQRLPHRFPLLLEMIFAFVLAFFCGPLAGVSGPAADQGLKLKFSLATDALSRGKMLEADGKPYEAIQAYQQGLKGSNQDPRLWHALGDVYFNLNMKEYAVQAYEAALRLKPDEELRRWLEAYKTSSSRSAPPASVDKKSPLSGTEAGNGPKDWLAPLWRSAIIPGWGQNYNGNKEKSWVLGGITIGLFAGVVGTYVWAVNAENNYMNLGRGLTSDNYDTAFSNWETASNTNHAVYICFGLAYFYTLYDAMAGAKAPGEMKANNQRVRIAIDGEGARATFELARF